MALTRHIVISGAIDGDQEALNYVFNADARYTSPNLVFSWRRWRLASMRLCGGRRNRFMLVPTFDM